VRYRLIFTTEYNYIVHRLTVDAFGIVDMDKLVAVMAEAKLTGKSAPYEKDVGDMYRYIATRSRFSGSAMYNLHSDEPLTRDQLDELLSYKQRLGPDHVSAWLKAAKI